MKYSIVNAYGRTNRGDSVLLDECIQEIRSIDSDPSISCVVFSGADEASEVYPDIQWSMRIGNVNGKSVLHRMLSLYYMFIAYVSTFRYFFGFRYMLPERQRRTLEAIKNSDVVVSAPGGYIHDTNFAYYIALFHIYLGVLLNKSVCLAPQSYGPIKSRFGKFCCSFVLSRCDAVCTREGYSHEFLKNELKIRNGILHRCGDSAFYNENKYRDLPVIDDEFKGILLDPLGVLGITVVGWQFPHRASPNEDYERYIDNLAHVIDEVVRRRNVKPVVFNQVDGDIPTALKLRDACGCSIYVDEVSREPEYLRPLISYSKVFIGTRFHSCIFAMMENVPTTAISYLPKTEYIMKDLRFSEKSLDICALDVEKAVRIVCDDIDNNQQSRAELAVRIDEYRSKFPTFSEVLTGIRRGE